MENLQQAQSQQKGPVEKTYDLTLTKTFNGQSKLKNPVCHYTVRWNFSTNMGEAILASINHTPTNMILHPLGLSGKLAFMSDIPPTPFNIDGQQVVISRAMLDLEMNLEASAAIMYEDGCIQATDNWQESDALSAKS